MLLSNFDTNRRFYLLYIFLAILFEKFSMKTDLSCFYQKRPLRPILDLLKNSVFLLPYTHTN